ncbi:cupin domain-containing protein [Rubellimicrobium rubrum]|uniref:cupin domain-containing protein n=1 Tax=Rubellimicrobium rubrum TaxID=2585369 RepID=UPI001FE8B8D0|nr:cupin domain-containing protein [Rubellimicrobium rubrum]
MADPLSQVIQLLRPRAVSGKVISGAGAWAVSYSEFGQPGFCAVIEGRCRLAVEGEAPVLLEEGDFVILPATPAFTMSGFTPGPPLRVNPRTLPPPTGRSAMGSGTGRPTSGSSAAGSRLARPRQGFSWRSCLA